MNRSTRLRIVLFFATAVAAASTVAQDPFGELPPDDSEAWDGPVVDTEAVPAEAVSTDTLIERFEAAGRHARETRALLAGTPAAEKPPEESPLRLIPEEAHLAKVYPDGRPVRYVAVRLRLVNMTKEPLTVRRDAFRLSVRGQELAPGEPPNQPGLRQIPLGKRPARIAELANREPVTVPADDSAGVTMAFFDVPGTSEVAPMTLSLPVGDRKAELDLNEYSLGLMQLRVERIGPGGLLGVVTVRGAVTTIGAGGLVEVLEKLSADGVSRAVLSWEPEAPPVPPELANWLVQAAAQPAGGVPLDDGQHPGLPAGLHELHLAALPDGVGGASGAIGPNRLHATVAEAAAAAVGAVYESLPVGDLLGEIESGHPFLRPAAVAAGGRLPDEKLPILLELAGGEDVEIAVAAIAALREFGSDAAVARLVDLSKTGAPASRFAAVESLAASRFAAAHEALRGLLDASVEGPPVIPPESLVPVLAEHPRPLWRDALYRLATTGDPAVRSAALEALARIGHPDLFAAFEDALAADDEELRSAAFRLLAQSRDAASEELALRFTRRHLESAPPTRDMYGLLQRTKDPASVSLLLSRLDDTAQNRSDVFRLLARIGGLEVRAALEEAYPQLDRTTQAQALVTLAQMRSPKFYDFAATALASNDAALVNAAAQQLQTDGGPEAVRLLSAMLSGSEKPVPLSNAANALAGIGTIEARAALRKASRSDGARARVAESAWWQLQRQSAGFDSFLAGYTAARQEDWKEAQERYSEAVELDPQFVDAWAGRANANMQLSDHAAARADYEKALELDPSDAAAVTCLGILRVFGGEVDEGLAFVRERTAGFEKNELFAYNSACLYAVAADRLDEKDRTRAGKLRGDAVKELARAVQLGMTDPDDVDWMTKDPDLKGLRDREDFKAVVGNAAKSGEGNIKEE